MVRNLFVISSRSFKGPRTLVLYKADEERHLTSKSIDFERIYVAENLWLW